MDCCGIGCFATFTAGCFGILATGCLAGAAGLRDGGLGAGGGLFVFLIGVATGISSSLPVDGAGGGFDAGGGGGTAPFASVCLAANSADEGTEESE